MIESIATLQRFRGRYRGVVNDNIDPLQLGRLRVRVPDVLGDGACIWARSASPLSGDQMGMYFVPPKGAGVWVEFEDGDPDEALWTGCWRGSASDLPPAALEPPPTQPPIVIQTEAENRIVLSSTPGQCMVLETSAGASGPRIEITSTSIKLSTGKGASVELTGKSVKINGDALTVD
ncbi:phage baseplate assembly protein V [Jidongwangia harbinensis]|uniref:phage baseplate assembly protein V n=1 Tax=Jidongwangia harbinensis TaxID=2878561 RepID=UPI001CD9252D|nr:phage baseplate assembly protein V [Jidongwangia harbinensis]MCA2218019.1 phage baseplate assembly protein V [Jidongwangia harbinensis]